MTSDDSLKDGIPDVPDGSHVDNGEGKCIAACGGETKGIVFKDYDKAVIARDKLWLRSLGVGFPCEECMRILRERSN